MITIKKTTTPDGEKRFECRCGNTDAQKGFEDSYSERRLGIYAMICRHCGRKFDEYTLEVVGVRMGGDFHNELISEEELEAIAKQSRRYFEEQYAGVLWPDDEASS